MSTKKNNNRRRAKPTLQIDEKVVGPNGKTVEYQGTVSSRSSKGKPASGPKRFRASDLKAKKKWKSRRRKLPAADPFGDPWAFVPRPEAPSALSKLTTTVKSTLAAYAGNGINDVGLQGYTAAPIIPPYDGASAYMHAILDPFSADLAHIPEPGNNIPNEAASYPPSLVNYTVVNGSGVPDGSVAFMLRGDAVSTFYTPASISVAHAITWAGGASYHTYGSFTTNYFTRPVVTSLRVRVIQTGLPHVVQISSFHLPQSALATTIQLGPTVTNIGVTSTERLYYDGRDDVLAPDQTATFVSSRCTGTIARHTWTQAQTDRGTSGMENWFIWIYGLYNTDRVRVEYTAKHEYISYVAAPLEPIKVALTGTTASSEDITNVLGDRTITHGARRYGRTEDDSQEEPGALQRMVDHVVDYAKKADWVDNVLESAGGFVARRVAGLFGNIPGLNQPPHPGYLFPTASQADLLALARSLPPTIRTPAMRLMLDRPPDILDAAPHEERKEDDDFRLVGVETPRLSSRPGPVSVQARSSASAIRS